MTESNFVSTSTDLDDVLAPRIWFKPAGNKIFSAGNNSAGQLGDNTTTIKCVFVQETTASGAWAAVSGGAGHVSALKSNGTLWSWGLNNVGQLGINVLGGSFSCARQEITSSTNWCFTSSGGCNTAAIKTEGSLWTWGSGACFALGRGNLTSNSCSPIREFSSSTDWSFVDVGQINSMSAIKQNGSLWSWGLNCCGKLGDGTTVTRSVPTREFTSSTNWCAVSLASFHSAAVKTDGTLWSWGCGANGALGYGSTTSQCSPVREVSNSPDWKSVSAGGELTTVALKNDNSLWIWGCTGISDLGTKCSPVQEITSSYDWYKHTVGGGSIMSVKTDGTLWGWGTNICGMLGNGSTLSVNTPTKVSIDTTWKDVQIGITSTHALKMSDTLCR
jgi:alpha-tubulin suppressor-like RCC1 family protein